MELAKAKTTDKFAIGNLGELRAAARLRYGKNNQPYLTIMAAAYGVRYSFLSDVLSGRQCISYIVSAIQKDFILSDEQVLACWPILRKWPRPDLEERAMRRAG